MTVRTLPNGDLLITADNQTRAYIAAQMRADRGYWSIMSDLFEPYSCNGSYSHFDAGAANPFVGLTSAPCVAESMSCGDDGENTIDGRLWYFDRYAIVDDLEELKNTGRVVYQVAA